MMYARVVAAYWFDQLHAAENQNQATGCEVQTYAHRGLWLAWIINLRQHIIPAQHVILKIRRRVVGKYIEAEDEGASPDDDKQGSTGETVKCITVIARLA